MTYDKYIWRALGLLSLLLLAVVPIRYFYRYEVPDTSCNLQGRFILKPKVIVIESDEAPRVTVNVIDLSRKWDFKEILRYHTPQENVAELVYSAEGYGPAIWKNPLMEVEPHYEHDFQRIDQAPNMDVILRFGQMWQAPVSVVVPWTNKLRVSDVNTIYFNYKGCAPMPISRANSIGHGFSVLRPLANVAIDYVTTDRAAWACTIIGATILFGWGVYELRLTFRGKAAGLGGVTQGRASSELGSQLTTIESQSAEDSMSDHGPIVIPKSWDEKELAALFGRVQADKNLVLYYFDQIFSRFILNQDAFTAEKRLAYLKQQNEVLRTYIDHKKLRGQIGRVNWEQMTETQKARADALRVEAEEELVRIRLDAEKEEARLRLDQAKKKREDLTKSPGVGSSTVANENTPEELRVARKAEADARSARIREEKRKVERDPTLDEEERIWALNDLDDKLSDAMQEAAKYL
jgi:hypothetical protein